MPVRVGDEIVVRGHHVGDADRRGVIVEVRGAGGEPPYVVVWSDGHQGVFFPSSDAPIGHSCPRGACGRWSMIGRSGDGRRRIWHRHPSFPSARGGQPVTLLCRRSTWASVVPRTDQSITISAWTSPWRVRTRTGRSVPGLRAERDRPPGAGGLGGGLLPDRSPQGDGGAGTCWACSYPKSGVDRHVHGWVRGGYGADRVGRPVRRGGSGRRM